MNARSSAQKRLFIGLLGVFCAYVAAFLLEAGSVADVLFWTFFVGVVFLTIDIVRSKLSRR